MQYFVRQAPPPLHPKKIACSYFQLASCMRDQIGEKATVNNGSAAWKQMRWWSVFIRHFHFCPRSKWAKGGTAWTILGAAGGDQSIQRVRLWVDQILCSCRLEPITNRNNVPFSQRAWFLAGLCFLFCVCQWGRSKIGTQALTLTPAANLAVS